MAGGGTKVGNAYVEVTPKAAGDFASVLDKQLGDGGSKGSAFGAAFSGGMKGMVSAGAVAIGNILSDVVKSGAGAVKDIMGDAFQGFADNQQLTGGMEKLFGEEAAQSVVSNAKAAFETAGMSANEYMEKATSISASLISSVGGDTEEAARLADVAIRAMSDNYNTFGTDAESVSNAFMGLAKQNYSMLDNLSLGYAGNQQGMMDLINDSGVLGEKLTDTSQLAEVGFGTMVEAIQKVQEQQGIAGTTFNEYQTTVQGSLDALSASWQNWLTSLGDPNADMGEATSQLLETIQTAGANALPLIQNIVGSISAALPGLVASIGPILVPAAVQMVSTVVPAIAQLAPSLLQAGMQLFLQLVQASVTMLPMIAQAVIAAGPSLYLAALDFFRGLGTALGELAPMLIDAVVYLVTHLPEIIVQGVAGMLDAGSQLVFGFIEGLTGNKLPAEETAGSMAAAATEAAMANSDASQAGANITDTMMASLDFGTVEASATTGMEDVLAAATAAADGAGVADQLAETTTGSVDVSAMEPAATEMVENAVDAAKAVDASSIGAEFSQKAAGGIDVSAMSSKISEAASAASALNTSATVSVKADLSGVTQLRSAATTVAGAYRTMGASVTAAMRQAAGATTGAAGQVKGFGTSVAASMRAAQTAASAAARSIRASVSSIPSSKVVTVSVARGSVELPHFTMRGKFDPKTSAVPTVSVSWWEKGGLFTRPAVIGVGEGPEPEGVFPLSRLERMMEPRDGGKPGSSGVEVNLNYTNDADAERMAMDVARLLSRYRMAGAR